MSKTIPLTKGYHAIVSESDYDRVAAHSWHYHPDGYAEGLIDGQHMRMHRFITDAPEGMDVDHLNNDGLDNRRQNLRVCTRSQNIQRQVSTTGESDYRGVSRSHGRWRAEICVQGTRYHLGMFDSERKAAEAYDARARHYYGEFAYTNFEGDEVKPAPKWKTSSQYRGVSWDKHAERWTAKIGSNGRQYHIGLFDDEVEAAKAYNEAAKKHHGDRAILNELN